MIHFSQNKDGIYMKLLAIDVGGTFTKYAIITDSGCILKKYRKQTVIEPLEDLICFLESIYKEIAQSDKIEGIALSMPGFIDSEAGLMYTGGSLMCINNLNIVQILENRCHVPVTVGNDAKCAARAELWQGALKDYSNAVVFLCGTAIGGALIHKGQIINGIHNMAGEFSYIITQADKEYGIENVMGNNTGMKNLLMFVSEETGLDVNSLNGERVFVMANQGNQKVINGIRRYVRNIAIQITNCQVMFDPEIVAIGGGISVQPLLIEMIREELLKLNKVFPQKLPIPKITVCQFFNDANLIGAVHLHLDMKKHKKNKEENYVS